MNKSITGMIDFRVAGYGRLSPQKDVTPYESSMIAILLTALALQPEASYSAFIIENNLQRHFVLPEVK